MATTPEYGLPYQSLTDPPHGPNLGQQLAVAVEAQLHRVDADIATVQAMGIVGGKIYNTPATGNLVGGLSSGGGEVQAMDTGPRNYRAGRRYRIPAFVHWNGSAANVLVEMRIREDNTAGVERAYSIACDPVIGTPFVHFLEGWYEPATDQIGKTFVVTAKMLSSGTINISRSGSALVNSATRVEVHEAGQSGKMTSA